MKAGTNQTQAAPSTGKASGVTEGKVWAFGAGAGFEFLDVKSMLPERFAADRPAPEALVLVKCGKSHPVLWEAHPGAKVSLDKTGTCRSVVCPGEARATGRLQRSLIELAPYNKNTGVGLYASDKPPVKKAAKGKGGAAGGKKAK